MSDMENSAQDPDKLSVNRQIIAQLRVAASQAVLSVAEDFRNFSNNNDMHDDPRRDVLENSETIQDVMLQTVLDTLRMPKQPRRKKPGDSDTPPVTLTFDDIKAGLTFSRDTFMRKLSEAPGIRSRTPGVIVELYDRVLKVVGEAVDEKQASAVEAAQRIASMPPSEGRG